MKKTGLVGGVVSVTAKVSARPVGKQLSFGNGMIMLASVAKPAGAKIGTEIKDEDYGGPGFSCYELEGHLWSFGSYDPW
jgi:hypothetical protein